MPEGGRKLQGSWIDNFVRSTSHLPSPEIMRLWAAISTVAGVMERKVWVRPYGLETYPNLYVILVAPAGVGKTVALTFTERFWRSITDLHVSPTSLTKAALVDSLADARRKVVNLIATPSFLEFNSLLVASGELGVLIPSWDSDFINSLTTIYDGETYDERRRGGDHRVIIEKPQLNLIGATTPSYLHDVMPQGAWEQGFISRVILVFSADQKVVELFPTENEVAQTFESMRGLTADLAAIQALQGEMQWDDDAKRVMQKWHLDGNPPIPTHAKLASYCTRRSVHAIKLSMVAAASRSLSMRITLDDVATALRWLIDVETFMPQIFTSFGAGGDETIIADILEFTKRNGPVPEHEMVRFIGQRVKAHQVMGLITIMLKSQRMVQSVSTSGIWYQATSPQARRSP